MQQVINWQLEAIGKYERYWSYYSFPQKHEQITTKGINYMEGEEQWPTTENLGWHPRGICFWQFLRKSRMG